MFNERWPFYLAASINKHFEDNIISDEDLAIAVIYEGLPRADVVQNAENIVEVRWTGPFWTRLSPHTWRALLILNCAAQTTINDEDNYKIWRVLGKIDKAFATPVVIKTYGDESEDVVGCLQLTSNKQDIVNNFLGQIDPSLQRVQGEVTAHFTIDLEE